MSKITLYEISAEQLRINEMLEESGGELTPEIEEALLLNEENFMVKAEGYIETIARYEAMSEAASERIAQLQGYKKTATNIAKRMRERLAQGMHIMGRDKVELGLHKIAVRCSTSVNITDEARLPNSFIIVETKPDKKRIGDALKSGELVPGAELVRNQSITIR